MERREFIRSTALVLLTGGTVPFMEGCTAAEVEADIQTVLNDLPTAINIAESIITIISAFKGDTVSTAQVQQLKSLAGQVGADLTLAQGLITQYQTDLAGAPATVIGELDSAVSDVQQNEQAILTAIHVYDPTTQAAISASIAAIDTVLLGLESIIPASAATKLPKIAGVLAARGKKLGAFKAGIPKPRDLAKGYNAKVKHDFPTAMVPVPSWL